MKLKTASRTAQYMALFRAIESNRPAKKRLFYDPFASFFLDNGLKLLSKLSGITILQNTIPRLIHKNGLGAISSGIARTKYIDDLLEKTIREGAKQVIILGAGFDTRGLRLQSLKDISVIEIDHPDTSEFKLHRLRAYLKALPDNVSYFQADFQKQTLDNISESCRIHFDLPTTIIWEGVTNYLTAEAIDQTLLFTRRFNAGFNFIFTYINKQVLTHPEAFQGTQKLFKNLRHHQEVWTFGFDPDELPGYLARFNLKIMEDIGAADYRIKYMPERTDIAEGYEFYRVVSAKKES